MKKNEDMEELRSKVDLATYGITTNIRKNLLDSSKDVNVNDLLSLIGVRDNEYTRQDTLNVQGKDNLTNLQMDKVIDGIFKTIANDEFFEQSFQNRVREFADYTFILNNMPQMMEAIERRVNDILSPDAFSGSLIDIEILTKDVDLTLTDVKEMLRKHDAAELVKQSIIKTLMYGFVFNYVCPFSEVADRLSNLTYYKQDKTSKKYKKNDMLTESMNRMQTEFADEISKQLDIIFDNKSVTKSVNNILFTESPLNVHHNAEVIASDCFSESPFTFGAEEFFKYTIHENMDMLKEAAGDKGNQFSKMTGCYTTQLAPERCAPQYINKKLIGVFYVDKGLYYNGADKITLGPSSNNIGGFEAFTDANSPNKNLDLTRQRLLQELSTLVKRNLDKKFITNNKIILDTLENIIRENDLISTPFKVRFIPAKFLSEFKINPDADGYGRSNMMKAKIPALFWIYLSKNRMMNKLFYEKDILVAYAKQSVSKDIGANVMKALTHMSKVVPLPSELSSITRVYTGLSDIPRLVVPTSSNDNRAITLEKIDGQKLDPDDPFMEKLERLATRLVGNPVSLSDLTSSDIKIARTIAQEDGNNVRSIVAAQDVFNRYISKLYSKIVSAEKGKFVELQVTLPPPTSLNSDIDNEKLERIERKITTILKAIYGEDPSTLSESEKKEMDSLRVQLYRRESAAFIDWDEIEKMKTKHKMSIENATEKLNKEEE